MSDKQPIGINFAHGIDTKTDPKQVPVGKFLSLQNSVFTTTGQMTKRYGYGALSTLPSPASYLTTFNGNITAIGSTLQAYASGTKSWLNMGTFQPISLSTLSMQNGAINNTQCDSVIAPNGFVCTVGSQMNNSVASYFYKIRDSVTNQSIVGTTTIPVATGTVTGSPRVFLVPGYFIVVFTNVHGGSSNIEYISISVNSPTTVSANAIIASGYTSNPSVAWDGFVVGSNLYIAYNTASGGQQIKITYLSSSFQVAVATSFAGNICTIMGMYADISNLAQIVIYAAFYDSAGSTGYVVAVDQNLNKLMLPTQIISTGTVNNITLTAQNGVATVVYEVAHNYSYDSTIASNFLDKVTVTKPATVTTGTVGTTTAFVRSVGLASKGFLLSGTMYVLSAYDGKSTTVAAIQPTYFLLNLSGNVIAKIAYQNGGGYLPTGLPQAQVIGTTVNIAYLFRDLVQSVNKTQGVANFAGVYSQTGINLASINFTSATLSTSEIGQNLNLSGGLLYSYDGRTFSEQNFNVYPDSVEAAWTASSAVTPTGTFSSGATTVVVSSASGVSVGMSITDTSNSYIPAGTFITAINGTTLTISKATTNSAAGDNLSIQGNIAAKPDGSTNTNAYFYQVIYQWTDSSGNIVNSAPSIPISVTTTGSGSAGVITVQGPYLRLTYKTTVKILIYRWSIAQQNYYQVTSITAPLLNVTTSDSWSFTDAQADSSILGNSLIYTTGGVIEDIGGPACTALTIFDTRLWLVDAEDQNLIWYSKQVIEHTPVEMSDLFTIYVAPNAGTNASVGTVKCIFPMDDKLIIFLHSASGGQAIYYLNGVGPDNTGANSQYSQPIFITSTVSSINQNSIVLSPNGLMFQAAGGKGIWLLQRDLTTKYIGDGVEAFNQYTVNSAVNLPNTTQIIFTLSNGTNLMYDYYFNEWSTHVGASAVSSTVYQNVHTIINSQGLVSQQTPGLYMDNGNPVLMQFTTGWINLAGLQGYQRAYYYYYLGEYISPHFIDVGIAYDYMPNPIQTLEITPNNGFNYFGGTSPFGGDSPFGGSLRKEQEKVHFKVQKCQAFQISMQERYDASAGIIAGAGFTLSGLNMVAKVKRGTRPIPAINTAG